MAFTKNPLIRYKILDRCFSNPGKRYFIADLIRECEKTLSEIDPSNKGISRRQILQDISFMESSDGWNIELIRHRIGKQVYYRYVNTSYSINNMPLNEVELEQIRSAIQILRQFSGMPQFQGLGELLPKLQQGLSIDQQKAFISFDSNQYLKGIDQLGSLYNSINYSKVLKIIYHDFKSENPYNLILHPYYLKQYNNRWFLFGYNPEKQKSDWNLALDRIISIEETNDKYFINKTVDWDEYFEDIIGVTKPVNAQLEHVTIHFLGETGKYIESKPLHGSQKSNWLNQNLLEVNLELIINYEFERLILSFADNAKVIFPSKLVELIKRRLENANQLYHSIRRL